MSDWVGLEDIKAQLGLKTDKTLLDAMAVRTPDGTWWEPNHWRDRWAPASRNAGHYHVKSDNVAWYEAQPRVRCGRGWKVRYASD